MLRISTLCNKKLFLSSLILSTVCFSESRRRDLANLDRPRFDELTIVEQTKEHEQLENELAEFIDK